MLLHEVIELAAERAPEQLALVDGHRRWTFAGLAAAVEATARGLAGIAGPGERVAVLSENRAEVAICQHAVPRAGQVLTLLNTRHHPEEWVAALERTGATVVLAEAGHGDRLAAHRNRLPRVRSWVRLDGEGPGTLADLAAEGATAGAARPLPDVAADDVAWLVHTSGTTGRAKAAELTHRGLLAAAMGTALCRPVAPDDVYLFPFPLFHVAGYNLLVQHLHARPVVLLDRFEAGAVLAMVAEHRITTMSLAPTMMAMLLDDPRLDGADLSTVRSVGYGASAIPVALLRRVLDRFGCEVNQGYGMTELSGNAVFLDAEAHRRGAAGEDHLLAAAGRPSPLVALRIVGLDDPGRVLPRGEAGEVAVRGDQVSPGYWDDPSATAAARTPDGWLRTGDVGRLDPDGLLRIVDRVKDVIVSGGENVASREVEDALADHPAVAAAAVIGVRDERWGERVAAVVVARPGATVDGDALAEHVRGRLAGYKVPRLVAVVDRLPTNAGGKVDKSALRAAADDLFG